MKIKFKLQDLQYINYMISRRQNICDKIDDDGDSDDHIARICLKMT